MDYENEVLLQQQPTEAECQGKDAAEQLTEAEPDEEEALLQEEDIQHLQPRHGLPLRRGASYRRRRTQVRTEGLNPATFFINGESLSSYMYFTSAKTTLYGLIYYSS